MNIKLLDVWLSRHDEIFVSMSERKIDEILEMEIFYEHICDLFQERR